jgi:hypothetical protein
MSAPTPELIPEDHAMWSVLTEDLVNGLLKELQPSHRSPAVMRLMDIIGQHPSNPCDPTLSGQPASAKKRTCVRNGIDKPLKKIKRNAKKSGSGDEGDEKEDERKCKRKKKEKTDTGGVWETDGVPPDPLPAASILLSRLGSATSREHLPKLVNLVRALISRTVESIEEEDYGFETSLKMCGINCTNRALQDLNHMIGYIRLGFHLDR